MSTDLGECWRRVMNAVDGDGEDVSLHDIAMCLLSLRDSVVAANGNALGDINVINGQLVTAAKEGKLTYQGVKPHLLD